MRISNCSFFLSQMRFDHRTIKFEPLLPKILRLRTYRQFDEEKFKSVFQNYLREVSSSSLRVEVLKILFLNALNKFAPVRKKYLQANHSRFRNKELSKALMHITKNTQARLAYNKQRNI